MQTAWMSLMRTGAMGLTALLATGCVDRTIRITSDPQGALVYVNDQEVGRTPCETAFLHYGTYDVRVIKDGYEPYLGPAEASPPLYDLPGPDLVADLLPVRLRSQIDWHFTLLPVNDDETAMIDRARQLRSRMHQEMGPPAEASPTGPDAAEPAPEESGG